MRTRGVGVPLVLAIAATIAATIALLGCGDDDVRVPDGSVRDAGSGGADGGGVDGGVRDDGALPTDGGSTVDGGGMGGAFDSLVYIPGSTELAGTGVDTIGRTATSLFTGLALSGTPQNVAAKPSAHLLFTSNYGGGTVTVARYDPATGALTQLGAAVSVPSEPLFVAVSPDGGYLFVATDTQVLVYAIDDATGALTMATSAMTSIGPRWIAATDTRVFVSCMSTNALTVLSWDSAGPTLGRVDQDTTTTGDQDFSLGAGTSPFGLAVHPTAPYVFVALSGSPAGDRIAVVAYDTTGRLTRGADGMLGAGAAPLNVEVDPTGAYVFAAADGTNEIVRFAVDGAGALTELGRTDAATPRLLFADARGHLWANTRLDALQVFDIDAASGALSPLLIEPIGFLMGASDFAVVDAAP